MCKTSPLVGEETGRNKNISMNLAFNNIRSKYSMFLEIETRTKNPKQLEVPAGNGTLSFDCTATATTCTNLVLRVTEGP